MTKPKAPSQLKNVSPPSLPRNAIQSAEAREKGLITGFLSNRKRGAPPKLRNNPKVPRVTHTTDAVTPIITTDIVPDKPTTSRGKYKNWKLEPYKSALDRAAEASLNGDDPQLAAGDHIIIPGATLRKRVKEINAALTEMMGTEYLYLAAELKENEKAAELRPGFERELGESDSAKILALSDTRLRLYIRYFFRVKVVNLTKMKGVDL
jgi:hypothetical protein